MDSVQTRPLNCLSQPLSSLDPNNKLFSSQAISQKSIVQTLTESAAIFEDVYQSIYSMHFIV